MTDDKEDNVLRVEDADFEPEEDLLGRYERMIQTQVETVNGIDEKSATTMRVVAVLLGVLLSLLTFLSDDYTVTVTAETLLPVLWVAVGVTGLLASLGWCLYTYLSSRMLFGPTADLGEVLSEHTVSTTDYQSHLLRGYATAIKTNREVIRTNSRRFRNTLLTLLYGLVGITTGLALFIISLPICADAIVSLVVLGSISAFTGYILKERYMVVPHED
ncbi:hypothetical protein [Natrinema thermotolerans]